MATPQLVDPYQWFSQKSVRHCEEFLNTSNSRIKAHCAISLYADWEEFCRKLFFYSALLRPITVRGNRLPRPPGVVDDASLQTILNREFTGNPRRSRVIYYGTSGVMIRASNAVDLVNRQQVSLALSVNSSPANDLNKVRNFLAHRNQSTAQQVVWTPIGIQKLSTGALVDWLGELQSGGVSRFEAWAFELRFIAQQASIY